VLQGNIAFAVGCVRSGIHSADGYPGPPVRKSSTAACPRSRT
jgi:hypothetical protein